MSMSSIISNEWELLDPCPDIHALFIEFNQKFFWGRLEGVEVKWSPRMTLCAGVCSYEGRGGLCSVRLSAPLLKLRPRKDLVETLLHEMIHAFLFVTANNRDRDGHGPEFQKHMNRINKECGCKITIYHSFHDEVRLYQQHVWRCDGVCKSRRPFFGLVRRSRNSAPCPRDRWWEEHQRTCGGTFVKIQEPEEFTKKKEKEAEKKNKKNGNKLGDIRKFVTTNSEVSQVSKKPPVKNPPKPPVKNPPKPATGNKGNLNGPAASTSGTNKVTRPVSGSGISTASNINGFGEPGKKGWFGGNATANKGGKTLVVTSNRNDSKGETEVQPASSFVAFVGKGQTVGTASTSTGNIQQDRQKFLDRFNQPSQSNSENPHKKIKTDRDEEKTHCPVCNALCPISEVNSHLDTCLLNLSMEDTEPVKPAAEDVIILSDDEEEEEKDLEQCPLCSAYYPKDLLQSHIDNCAQHLHDSFIEWGDEEVKIEPPDDDEVKIELQVDSVLNGVPQENQTSCPVCGIGVDIASINSHLDSCLAG